MEFNRQTAAAAGQDVIKQCSEAVQAYYSECTDITIHATYSTYYWTEQNAEYDSIEALNSALESYISDTYQDYYRDRGYFKNGVLVLDLDTIDEIEETAFLEVEPDGMSGTNPGYYLYWITYPDGTEDEINVKPEY